MINTVVMIVIAVVILPLVKGIQVITREPLYDDADIQKDIIKNTAYQADRAYKRSERVL